MAMKHLSWVLLAGMLVLFACDNGKSKKANNANNVNNVNNTNNVNNINNVNNTNNVNNAVIIEPGDPGPADIEVFADAVAAKKPISPWIYGMNTTGIDALPVQGIPFWRIGGNRWTAYNWENNASNAGSDWNYQSDGYLGGGNTPGQAVVSRVDLALADGADVMVTLAMAGKVAADKDGPVAGDGSQANSNRFRDACPAKPGSFVYPPDLNDACVYQDELVARLMDVYGADFSRIVFSLDNEPDLWSDTHSQIHPEPATYAEVGEKSLALAAAVKEVAPEALVFGYAGYGYYGFVTLSDAPDAGVHDMDFVDYFLRTCAQAEADHGRRLVDVMDIHWYPEARGGGVRITADSSSPETAAARMQAPRSLWDPDYMENSWITNDYLGGPIRLIPWLQERIDQLYPGTLLSISEYYYGGGDHISGAIAQADVLGIFGREGVVAANLWHLGNTDDAFIHAAFRMFLDHMGNGNPFGQWSVSLQVSDTGQFSAYAAKRQGIPYELQFVLINKADAPVTVALRARDTNQYVFGRIRTLTQESAEPQLQPNFVLSADNAGVVTLPAFSVSSVVLMPAL